jgi:ribosomal protein S18 acetylase RimI-like enzyme
MSPITAAAEVFDAIQRAKAGASAFCTNFFPAQAKLQGWINHGELLGELRDRSAFFLRKDRDLWHLFFCAADIATLRREIAALPCLRTEWVAVDLVGSETVVADLLNVVEPAGFKRYARLLRLARANQPEQPQPSADGVTVVYPDRTDCRAIMDLLECSFDRLADQLPMPYEIDAALEARQILAVKCEGALAALLFFESQGFTSTIRYWVVAERFRSRRLGSVLMRHYFAAQTAVRRFILWVTAENDNAALKYRHYGYAPDGLIDHVLVNRLVHS